MLSALSIYHLTHLYSIFSVSVTMCNRCVNLHKQHEIITELKKKEAEIIRQMQRTPKQFDQSKLKVDIKCPEPSDIAAGLNLIIDNQQPGISASAKETFQPSQTTQERFQIGNHPNTFECNI